mgnify:CR=1 FL=1
MLEVSLRLHATGAEGGAVSEHPRLQPARAASVFLPTLTLRLLDNWVEWRYARRRAVVALDPRWRGLVARRNVADYSKSGTRRLEDVGPSEIARKAACVPARRQAYSLEASVAVHGGPLGVDVAVVRPAEAV